MCGRADLQEAESSGRRKGKKRAVEPEPVEDPEAAAAESGEEDGEAAAEPDSADEQDKGLPSFSGLDQVDMDDEDDDVEDEVASFDGTSDQSRPIPRPKGGSISSPDVHKRG